MKQTVIRSLRRASRRTATPQRMAQSACRARGLAGSATRAVAIGHRSSLGAAGRSAGACGGVRPSADGDLKRHADVCAAVMYCTACASVGGRSTELHFVLRRTFRATCRARARRAGTRSAGSRAPRRRRLGKAQAENELLLRAQHAGELHHASSVWARCNTDAAWALANPLIAYLLAERALYTLP